jgi:hypothetical protein
MFLVFLCLLILDLQACERRPPDLIGAWQSGIETMEFFKDGSVRVRKDTGQPQPVIFTGKYRLMDRNSIRLDMKATAIKINMTFTYSITGDTLILKNAEFGEVTYQRRAVPATTRSWGNSIAPFIYTIF